MKILSQELSDAFIYAFLGVLAVVGVSALLYLCWAAGIFYSINQGGQP